MVVIILIVEVLLFVLVWKTTSQYDGVIPPEFDYIKELEGAWSFGQIIPFAMIIYPILMAFTAWMEDPVMQHVEERMTTMDIKPKDTSAATH